MDEPVDEHKLLRDVDRAAKAEYLINDELLKEAFSTLEQAYMKAWRETGAAESETFKRERLWLAVNLIGKVQEHLNVAIQNGKLAKAHLTQIAGRKTS